MNSVDHHYFQARDGLNLHFAQSGTGSQVVILLHGFPEIWYTWRHQIEGLSSAGYTAIAPDYRGYGLSDKPPNPETTSFTDLVDDLVTLFDHLSISKAFLVAKDFGVRPMFLFALLHPDRVHGLVSLGVPYSPPRPSSFHQHLPEGFYISRWRQPGRAEADFSRFNAKTVIRNIYILFSRSEIPIAEENQEIMDMVEPSAPLPPWLSEQDLANYGSLYERSGFETPLKVPYRSIDEKYDIADPVLKQPVLVIMGGKDYFLKFPGVKEYIDGEKVKEFSPNLEILTVPEGTHFLHEQLPQVVNQFIIDFLGKIIHDESSLTY